MVLKPFLSFPNGSDSGDDDGIEGITNGVALLMNDQVDRIDEQARNFFELFSDFQLNLLAPSAVDEFRRLAKQRCWAIGTACWRENWNKCFGKEYDGELDDQILLTFDHRAKCYFGQHRYCFAVDLSATPLAEFYRLAKTCGWLPGTAVWIEEYKKCFGVEYGTRPDKIATKQSDASKSVAASGPVNAYLESMRAKGFVPDYSASLNKELARLAQLMGWKKGSKTYKNARAEMLVADASRWYQNESILHQWQALCADVGVSPVPGSITKCKQALSKLKININNYLNFKRGDEELKLFRTDHELFTYTFPKRVFPKDRAKKGCLRGLLRKF